MLSSVGLLNDLEVMRIVIISYSCKQKNKQQAQIGLLCHILLIIFTHVRNSANIDIPA